MMSRNNFNLIGKPKETDGMDMIIKCTKRSCKSTNNSSQSEREFNNKI